ncbi:MAG: hypothetical protein KC912_22755 [Proteobacteria bacterium]|nr:hypothetical protein [Pseudomonadota bacterium]
MSVIVEVVTAVFQVLDALRALAMLWSIPWWIWLAIGAFVWVHQVGLFPF